MTSPIYYNGQEYERRTSNDSLKGYLLATAASGAVLAPLPWLGMPFQKQLIKEMPNNREYKDAFFKALDISGLKEKGVNIVEAQKVLGAPPEYALGRNACYIPSAKQVLINTDKISCAGLHELGHAMNDLMSKYGVKYLAKMRGAGYAIAGLMEYFAIFSRTKPKGAPRSFTDVIEDNCGKIAFLAMLPVVIEEAIASYRGIKLAKKAGLAEPLVKNMKKLLGKALLTYGGRAVLGGLAVYASRKVMDYFTRPKEINY
jgi:hypothetical protein